MNIGVVSDTHGHIEFTRPAIRMLESLDVEQVIHCGDIGSVGVVEHFNPGRRISCLATSTCHRPDLQEAIVAAGHTCHGRFGTLELAGRRIAFLHGDDARLLVDTIGDGLYDLVCYGHTHQAEQHRAGKTWVLNPGALYRASPHSLAIVRLPEIEITHVTL